ncbi:MAG: hypothetical protein ACT4QE_03635 [Anaerolineales bacterium]
MASTPLYTSRGQWAGMLIDNFLYNELGEWIGWVEPDMGVYSVSGVYVGMLSKDMRVLAKRAWDHVQPHRAVPTQPAVKIVLPTHAPLPPLMAELNHDTIDVLEEMPERLHTLDADPNAKDLD